MLDVTTDSSPDLSGRQAATNSLLADIQPVKGESLEQPPVESSQASVLRNLANQPDGGDQQIQWQTDLKQAFAQSQSEHKPMIVEIGATWCGYCKTMNDKVVADQSFQKQFADKAIFVRLDAENDEAGKAIASAFKVDQFPTFLVLDTSHGSMAETGRTVGYMEVQKFCDAIISYLPQGSTGNAPAGMA